MLRDDAQDLAADSLLGDLNRLVDIGKSLQELINDRLGPDRPVTDAG